ncbi:hypothetical protein HNR33_002452 [Brassicibacter mesophilus]
MNKNKSMYELNDSLSDINSLVEKYYGKKVIK